MIDKRPQLKYSISLHPFTVRIRIENQRRSKVCFLLAAFPFCCKRLALCQKVPPRLSTRALFNTIHGFKNSEVMKDPENELTLHALNLMDKPQPADQSLEQLHAPEMYHSAEHQIRSCFRQSSFEQKRRFCFLRGRYRCLYIKAFTDVFAIT